MMSQSPKIFKSITFAVTIGLAFLLYFYFFQFRSPRQFPETAVVEVSNGKGLTAIAAELEAEHIIQSKFWFINFVILLKHERQIVGGEYYFDRPMNVYQIARRLTAGDFQIEQLKTTVPEGSTTFDISNILLKNYSDFDSSTFISLALPKEGYLFPDTYKFGTSIKPQAVIDTMMANFVKKVGDQKVRDAIAAFGKPQKDIIIMASILEGEGRQMHTRQMIAGILWNRIKLGIPLQVDAAFRYVNGKTSSELTLDDLKIESAYNTYIHTGLPPGPISNPGIESIMAAVTPIKSDYLYFLTDKNGNMHYAETLDEHVQNKQKYLP